jgi:16S rRNA (uracil1498-N3)-methyltransferase
MHRFFLPPEAFVGPSAHLSGDVVEQVRRVLRMRPGDQLILLDGEGFEYTAVLTSLGKDEAWADISERRPVVSEPRLRVQLYLSLLNKADKFEWALQKCTELGAARFTPVIAERSVADRMSGSRRERWERIIQEAAEQSGRGLLPELADPLPLREALAREKERLVSAEEGNHIVLLPEVGQSLTVREVLAKRTNHPVTASLFIGPEGGFSPAEVEAARDSGVVGLTLGPRILRAETAAVAGLTLILFEAEEMN